MQMQATALFLSVVAATAAITSYPVARHDPSVAIMAAIAATTLGWMLLPMWGWRWPVLAAVLTITGAGAACGLVFALLEVAGRAWTGEVLPLTGLPAMLAGMVVMVRRRHSA